MVLRGSWTGSRSRSFTLTTFANFVRRVGVMPQKELIPLALQVRTLDTNVPCKFQFASPGRNPVATLAITKCRHVTFSPSPVYYALKDYECADYVDSVDGYFSSNPDGDCYW